ncbi:glycoside hydrolase family 64 protein [Streptomyces sp. NPDC098781]|uniref:glycoside hydrolase family 64 protein n=1 Tax=Streptomyces sp. NPDC098781 TaxID=3366097 RepID=UPI0038140CE4
MGVGALAVGISGIGPVPTATAVPPTIPLMFRNASGLDKPVYIYNLGTELSTGRQGWADAKGTFHPWPAGGPVPTPAPDASIAGPAAGKSITIQIPKFSGRVYFSYGRKLDFRLVDGKLVQPAVQSPSDPNRNTLFNWSEYTLNDGGLWLNSTQVDMFSAPYAVGLKRTDGTVQKTGRLRPGGYREFYTALKEQPGGWGNLIQKAPDGTVLRALAPSHGIGTGLLPANTMDDYINRVWRKYSTTSLTVSPFADKPGVKYHGRVSGNVMNFTDGSGSIVTGFEKPDSDSVFGCYKQLSAPNDEVRGPISRTLCAAYNRATLLSSPQQPDTSSARAYQAEVTNPFAQKVHALMADGKAYAFAFDDVGNQESLVHDADPQKAYLTLDPLD